MIVGEEGSAEFLGECNVDGVGRRHVVPSGPCISLERRRRSLSEVPSSGAIDRLLSSRCGKGHGTDGLVSEHVEHFHVEVFRNPQLGVARQESCERTPRGVADSISTPAEASTTTQVEVGHLEARRVSRLHGAIRVRTRRARRGPRR